MNFNFLNEIKSNYYIIPYNKYRVLIPLNDHLMEGYTRDEWYEKVWSDDYLPWPDGTYIKKKREEYWIEFPIVNYNNKYYFNDKDMTPKYEISTLGKMRYKKTKKRVKYHDEGNYFRIQENGRYFPIHRLVAFAFHPIKYRTDAMLFDEVNYQVDHKNGCKIDNQVDNLRISTISDNLKNRIDKEIIKFYNFKAPELNKNPKMQYDKQQKIIIIDDIYLVLSNKDLNGLLNKNNTKNKSINLNKCGKFMKKYKLSYLSNNDKEDLMREYLPSFFDSKLGKYTSNIIGGRY